MFERIYICLFEILSLSIPSFLYPIYVFDNIDHGDFIMVSFAIDSKPLVLKTILRQIHHNQLY